ncbi:unnamed protein product [Zymoseptoria tritici ST99CH_1E4]|uniref:Uncharacterized protein n=1 Tax=Zymoseptoria tritici ST99CH_1E4 TaxID=1276532 RepID=A0A2H1FP45_ZYMTR|nr:unnamed protein product [Zymoseptoria tritici ST99CH_1E4]
MTILRLLLDQESIVAPGYPLISNPASVDFWKSSNVSQRSVKGGYIQSLSRFSVVPARHRTHYLCKTESRSGNKTRDRVIDRIQDTLYHSSIEFTKDSMSASAATASPDGLIELQSQVLQDFSRLHSSWISSDEILTQWVLLAYSLVHELAHRMDQHHYSHEHIQESFTIFGTERRDFFGQEMSFERNQFAEMGYALEKFLVGGQLYQGHCELLLRKLPNPGWLRHAPNDVNHIPYPYVPAQSTENVAVVDISWVRKHFDAHFWATTMPQSKGQALRVPLKNIKPKWYADRMAGPLGSSVDSDATSSATSSAGSSSGSTVDRSSA